MIRSPSSPDGSRDHPDQGDFLSQAADLRRGLGRRFSGDPSIVATYVSYLHRKLDPLGPPLIHTVRLAGYALREAEAA
jgi:two-component system, OmpR family, response regulator